MTLPSLLNDCVIYLDGEPIQRSQNLRGIRRYVGQHAVTFVELKRINEDTPRISSALGMLYIVFDNGATFETPFASFKVLKNVVRQWRNLYGVVLKIEGEDKGNVQYDNPALDW